MKKHEPDTPICPHCEKCAERHDRVLTIIQYLNDRIYELNKLIEESNLRYNERGNTLSYIS